MQTGKMGIDTDGLAPHPCVVDKNGEGHLGSEEFQPRKPGPTVQVSSARKTSPHNFWLQKPAGIGLVEETTGVLSSSS